MLAIKKDIIAKKRLLQKNINSERKSITRSWHQKVQTEIIIAIITILIIILLLVIIIIIIGEVNNDYG